MNRLLIPFQILLGIGSWKLHILVRWVMRLLTVAHAKRNIDNNHWRVFSEEMMRKPLVLPAILTSAPRWNPHAIIATGGPVRVRETLSFAPPIDDGSVGSWSLSVYTFPKHKLVATQGTLYPDQSGLFVLPAGTYLLAWRFQSIKGAALLPEIRVDGLHRIDACPVAEDQNRFYERLAGRTTRFLTCLNYYVYVMLRFRNWLPQTWVTRTYVPVGSADTEFLFGPVEKGKSVTVNLPAQTLLTHEVSFTQYNLASLPIFWTLLDNENFSTVPSRRAGSYLVRIRRRSADPVDRPTAIPAAVGSH